MSAANAALPPLGPNPEKQAGQLSRPTGIVLRMIGRVGSGAGQLATDDLGTGGESLEFASGHVA